MTVPPDRSRRTGQEQQPEDEFVEAMAQVAATHWWYRARREWLQQEVARWLAPASIALDVGTGSGETLMTLRAMGTSLTVGTDLSQRVLAHAKAHTALPGFAQARAEALPFATGVASCLTSMDVIEHLDDDVAALREYRRVLRPGAVVFITVPAYEWLWSRHDELAGHRRRYTARRLVESITAAGLHVERTSYFFSFLVPLGVVLRRTPLRRLVIENDDNCEVSASSPRVDKVLAALARVERVIAKRVRVPFGMSILVVARR